MWPGMSWVMRVSVSPGAITLTRDALRRELERQAADDGVHAGLRRDVGQLSGAGTRGERRTGCQQDAAFCSKMRDRGSERDQDAGQVDGQDPVPVVEIEIGERSCRREDARVRVCDA